MPRVRVISNEEILSCIVFQVNAKGLKAFARLLDAGRAAAEDFAKTPDALLFLKALNNSGEAGVALIGRFFAIDRVVWTLTERGEAATKEIFRMIEAQPPAQQAKILDAAFASSGLNDNGAAVGTILLRAQLKRALPESKLAAAKIF